MEDQPTIAFAKKKSLGQNFLTSPIVPGWMCDAANIDPSDLVLEIGPGTGALTKELLSRGAKVVALEADQRALAVLKDNFKTEVANGLLEIHHTDARELDITKYGFTNGDFKVVSNIPYYLTGWLFRSLLENQIQPNSIIFLIQKEVAERIARADKESLLSLSVKVFGDPTYVRTVSKGHFSPSPKIDSAIIAVRNINRKHFKNIDTAFFFMILHLGFAQKRKQLLGNLSKTYNRNILYEIFTELKMDPKIRAEDLSVENWFLLIQQLKKCN
jgi:16S rRNA (adenine1518-N6/adenine1519-N6)-dimethyltransferase